MAEFANSLGFVRKRGIAVVLGKVMKIEGVPDGWELVRIGRPRTNEWSIGGDGTPWQYLKETQSEEFWPIIRKAAPPCVWQHGVFNDGWVAQDGEAGNHRTWWYKNKPRQDGGRWEPVNDTECCELDRAPFAKRLVLFRDDISWTDRIAQVGPSVENLWWY